MKKGLIFWYQSYFLKCLEGLRTKSWTIRNGNTTCITTIKNLRLYRCISGLRTIRQLEKYSAIQIQIQHLDVG